MRLLALLFLAPLVLMACDATAPDADATVLLPGDAEFAFDGRVSYTDVEGGAWILVSDAGDRYEPTNLPEAYRIEGLRVRVEADRRPDWASVLMVGEIIEIRRIARR